MIRGLLGDQRRQSSLGATRASCGTQASRWPGPDPPASPPLQGQSKPVRGGARPQGRARSGASGEAGKGLWLVLVFAKRVWEGNRQSRGEGGRPVKVILLQGRVYAFVFNFMGKSFLIRRLASQLCSL